MGKKGDWEHSTGQSTHVETHLQLHPVAYRIAWLNINCYRILVYHEGVVRVCVRACLCVHAGVLSGCVGTCRVIALCEHNI